MKARRIGDILLETGKFTPDQLEQAVKMPSSKGRPIGEVLRDLGYINDDDIARALAVQLDIPFVELGDDLKLEKEEVKLIPEAVARRYGVLARRDGSGAITLVMKDPLDLHALDTIRSLTSQDVIKAVSTESRIHSVIDRSYTEDAHIERNLREIATAESDEIITTEIETTESSDDQLRVIANDAPVVKFVNLLLMQAIRDRASDIHFEPFEKEVHVRLRVDGELREVTPPPKALYAGVVTRIKILSNMDISERRLPLDGRFKFSVQNNRIIDVRVSSLPCVHGEKMVLRILDRNSLVVDLKDVGFDEDLLGRFKRILQMPYGIILLTGPTGSGKTTTLYGALTYLRAPEVNIQTVEDPVEYLLPGINQMAVKAGIGLDFATALRAILRQDPDIVMIGEMRDMETAQIAMRAALTGHLVLSTLHTNDSPSAFWRLRDIGVEPYLISATISLVISQRLVRRNCPHCKVPVEPTPEELRIARLVDPHAESWNFMKGQGCLKCSNRGYRGRQAIFEFLEVTDPIREMIVRGTGTVELRERAIQEGMQTLLVNGMMRVRSGDTTVEEVLAAAPETDVRYTAQPVIAGS